jgi:DNA-binding LacI/PurR family transcriptional regulator
MERSRSALKLLSGKIVDGIITMDAFARLPELTTLIGNAPWVQCAEYADEGDVSCVGINDVDAAQCVIEHLLARGCQRIALINHDLSYKYARLREQGYTNALQEKQSTWKMVEYAQDLSFSAGKAAMENLLRADERPDAVFAVSDTLAAGALLAIHEAGLAMPQDIAVVGFDGTELAEMVTPPLSTIQQPSREIGRQAVGLLLNKIDNPEAPAERIMMDWQYISRASA